MTNLALLPAVTVAAVASQDGDCRLSVAFQASGVAIDTSGIGFSILWRSISGGVNAFLSPSSGAGITNGGATGIVTFTAPETAMARTPVDTYVGSLVAVGDGTIEDLGVWTLINSKIGPCLITSITTTPRNVASANSVGYVPGPTGSSAYQLAVTNGYTGTLTQWLASLVGDVTPAATAAANTAVAQAGIATAEAGIATAQAGTATTEAGIATSQATSATNAASAAQVAATTATTQATAAAGSAASASTSAATLAASIVQFNALYLGKHATDPLVDGSGNALVIGAEYFNTAENKIRVYGSSGWADYDAAAQQDVTNAAASATAAAGSAASASTAATSAANAATASANSASTASTQASNAATSATSAGGSSTSASNSAATASTQAGNAATSATTASNAATAASSSATAASGSASTATTQATNAGNSATAAAGSASTATTQAGIATTQAGLATTAAASTAADRTAVHTDRVAADASAALVSSALASAGSVPSLPYVIDGLQPAAIFSAPKQAYVLNGSYAPVTSLLSFSTAQKYTVGANGNLVLNAANGPAWDWSTGRQRLLVEAISATNYWLNSETGTSWHVSGGAVTTATNALFGILSLSTLASSTSGQCYVYSDAVSVAAGASVTAEFALLAGSVSGAGFEFYGSDGYGAANTSSASIVSGPGSLTYSGGTNSVSMSGLSTTTPTVIQITRTNTTSSAITVNLYINVGGFNASTISGNSVKIGRLQVELASTPSSYIVSGSSATTRAADVVTAASGLLALLQGPVMTFAMRGHILSSNAANRAAPIGSPSKPSGIYFGTADAAGLLPNQVGGINDTPAIAYSPALTSGVADWGFSYANTSSSRKMALLNSGLGGDTNGGFTSADTPLQIGASYGGNFYSNLYLDELVVWPFYGSDAGVQAQARAFA